MREGWRERGRQRCSAADTASKHSDSESRRSGSAAQSSSCGCLMRGNPSEGDADTAECSAFPG